MKISCESCGSKYTIADAKVQGRKVKVRCKSCKAMILVDGTQPGDGSVDDSGDEQPNADDGGVNESLNAPSEKPAAAPAAASPKSQTPTPASTGKKGMWSVNLTDDDSRDMTTVELIAGWKSGLVTTDAYVWKDGMGDWMPVLEVPELKQKLLAAKPLKDDGVVSSAGKSAGAARSGDDLFGNVDVGGGVSEAPAAQAGGDKKPTGARNESSVLFSLDSLGSNLGGGSAQKTDANEIFGSLGGGSGGSSFGSNQDLLTAPALDPPPAPAGARAAVAYAPAPSKGKGGLIAAILGGAVIVGGVLFFALGSSGPDEASIQAAKAAEEMQAQAAEAMKKAEEQQKKLEEQQKKMLEEMKKVREEAAAKGEDPEEAAKKKQEELDAKKKEEEEKEKAASGSGSKSPSSPSPSGSPSPSPSPAPTAAPSGGASFDVGAAKAALSAAAANSASCAQAGGPTGAGRVQVTFSPSGRVTSANVVSGPFGGTPVGGCVASTFRRAKVPPFSGTPQTVAKSFSIR